MGFDHNDKKKCAFPHARHFTGGRCRLPWRVLTLADEHYQVLKTFSTLDLHAEKKGKFRTVFQNILFISQFMNCFIAARGKSKIETTGVSVK